MTHLYNKCKQSHFRKMKGRPATNGCRPANRGEYEIEMKGVSFRLQIIHEKYFVFNKISIKNYYLFLIDHASEK